MYEYLWGFDLTGWKAKPIATPLRQELKMDSLELPVRFLVAIVLENVDDLMVDGRLHAHTATLFNVYERWKAANGIGCKTSSSVFGKQIAAVSKPTRLSVGGKQALGHSLMRAELIERLRKHMNEPTFAMDEEPANGGEPDGPVLEDNVDLGI